MAIGTFRPLRRSNREIYYTRSRDFSPPSHPRAILTRGEAGFRKKIYIITRHRRRALLLARIARPRPRFPEERRLRRTPSVLLASRVSRHFRRFGKNLDRFSTSPSRRHRCPIFPRRVPSIVFSSSSFSSSSSSSTGHQLRVTCASADRTRSWPRVMGSPGASGCTWSRRSCRQHKRPERPTRVTARVAAAQSSSAPGGRSSGPPGRPSGEPRTTPADPSAPPRTCRRWRSPRRR